MRTGRVLVALSFVLVTVAACKGQTTSATAPGASSVAITTVPSAPASADQGGPTLISPNPPASKVVPPVVPPPTQPAPPNGGATVPPSQVQTGSIVKPPQGVRVTHGGMDVVFTSEQAGCQQISAKATSQTAKAVTILVTTTVTSRGSQVCPLFIREVPIVVVLDAPLGSRTLVFQGVTKHN